MSNRFFVEKYNLIVTINNVSASFISITYPVIENRIYFIGYVTGPLGIRKIILVPVK